MPVSKQSQIAASIIALLGVAYLFVFDTPFIATVIFTVLCVAWSAWIFLSIFRGTDELNSASIRHALATASGVGVPLSLAFVMLMVATPSIQGAITNVAMFSRSGLSPAAIGFALGVTFSLFVSCAVFAASHTAWWISKR